MPIADSVMAALFLERRAAREKDVRVVHVRVTTDAIRNSIALVPITPERARTLGTLYLLPDETVVADAGRLHEIVMHPEDFRDLKVEKDNTGRFEFDAGRIDAYGFQRVVGLPLVDDAD